MMELNAVSLYAISQGTKCSGPDECFWCASPCERTVPHSAPPRVVGQKYHQPCKRPGNQYQCVGCQLLQRRNITINFLEGGFKDRQAPLDWSWWITEKGAWAVRRESYGRLYDFLLNPPLKFSLCLMTNPEKKKPNLFQYGPANDMVEIKADTKLKFMLDNTVLAYTIYDLEQAVRYGPDGKEPGARELVTLLGPHPKIPREPEPERRCKLPPGKPGQVQDPRKVNRTVVASGVNA